MNVRVSARELRFRRKSEPRTSFSGAGERISGVSSQRENLPDDVETGTTYRRVRVSWRAASSLVPDTVEADLERSLRGGRGDRSDRS